MPKRILVASDFSEASSEAIRQACAYAETQTTELALCHVLPHLFGVRSLFAPRNEASLAQASELERRVRSQLERHAASLMPGRAAEIFVEHGSAYAEIVRRAEAWSADLLVLGNNGGPGRGHLGTVVEQVVRNAHCAVLVARPSAKSGVVVAATDFSDPALPAVAAGGAESRRRDARFVLIHAVDFAGLAVTVEEMFLNATRPPGDWDIDQQVRDAVVVKLESALTHLGVAGDARVVQGTAGAAIVSYAADVAAELIVVGNRGRTGLARLALGSVAERVVRTASCSVLTVRLAK